MTGECFEWFNLLQLKSKQRERFANVCEVNEGGVGGSVCIGKIVVLVDKNEYLDRLGNKELQTK